MKSVELYPGIHSSVLGFGCAPILGAVGATESHRAIEIALEHGVNHFDLARSYGYGDAERFVGRVLAKKRHSVRIATKFGIRANWKAKILRPIKPIVRRFKQRHASFDRPTVQPTFRYAADRFHDRVPIDAKHLESSLNESLRALRTDFVDFLFIHEPEAFIEQWEDVFSAAARLKKAGKVRCFGLATPNPFSVMHESYLDQFDVLQFAKPSTLSDYSQLIDKRGSQNNVIFSPLRNRGDTSAINELIRIRNDFQKSVILCTMFNPNHIEANIRALE